jgi:hypothetical protein
MSLDRYTQSTLNVARHAKKSEVETESQIEYQEFQEGQASSAAPAAEGCCQHSGARGCPTGRRLQMASDGNECAGRGF